MSVESMLGTPDAPLALRVCGGPLDGQSVTIVAPKCSIGSGRMRTLRLRQPGVRRMHCLILRGARGTVVRRWSPETRLNGQAFSDAPLQLGDRLTVGPVELEVISGAARDVSPALAELKRSVRLGRSRARNLVRSLREARAQLHESHQELAKAKLGQSELQEQIRQSRAAHEVTQQRCSQREAELARETTQLEARKAEFEQATARLEERRERDTLQRDHWETFCRHREEEMSRREAQLNDQQRELNSQRALYAQQFEAFGRRMQDWDSQHRTMPPADDTQDHPRLP